MLAMVFFSRTVKTYDFNEILSYNEHQGDAVDYVFRYHRREKRTTYTDLALLKGIQLLSKGGDSRWQDKTVRRMIIVLTDGKTSSSRYFRFLDAIEKMNEKVKPRF